MAGRNPRIQRYARLIKVRGNFPGEPEEVYTRFSRQQYEKRREVFEELYPNRNYDQETEWGSQGGRPRKWNSEAERKRAERARNKLATGRPLTTQEKALLGLTKKRPGAYKSSLGRPMTAAERKAKWKGGKSM